MKMVKSLLLGSAAGLVAIASAQAADLPVKAKPVQYVKICSLYGAGFYYIPGTDICLKVGGWVRFEAGYGTNGNIGIGPFVGNLNDRTTHNSVWRSRGYITADARSQTEYGTLRSYIAVGVSGNDVGNGDNAFSANRAFIQWAGFTIGHASSFFDFFSPAATGYYGWIPGGDTGDGGWKVFAYTARFGSGFSATISAEESYRSAIINTSRGAFTNFYTPAAANLAGTGGNEVPDIVANLRVDQAWGSAQLMGALHQVRPAYYGATQGSGHPSDKMGWAVGAGLKLNAPMVSPGDFLQVGVIYAEGATGYTNRALRATQLTNFDGANLAYGFTTDAVYGVGTGLELTKSWSIAAAYEHFWNRQWKTSLWTAYGKVNYNANANALLTAAQGLAAGTANNDWSQWHIGSRTQWNVTKDFYIGLEVLYSRLESAKAPPTAIVATGTKNAGVYTSANQENWAARLRVHRDFMP